MLAPGSPSCTTAASTAGFWKDLIGQIVDNNRVSPAWTVDDLRRVQRPTLLIAGENDPFANTEQMITMKRRDPRRRSG